MNKKTLLISLSAIIIGGIFASIAWGLGADTSLRWGGWHQGFVVFSDTELVEFSNPLADFSEIVLEAAHANITLQKGDAYHIEGSHPGAVDIDVRNGVLFVDLPGQSSFSFGIGFSRSLSSQVTITVPYGTVVAAADFSIELGNIEVDQVALERADLETGLGNITVTSRLTGTAQFTSRLGNIALTVKNGDIDDFSYHAITNIGSIAVGAIHSSTGSVNAVISQTLPNPLGTIHAETNLGNITITFQEA